MGVVTRKDSPYYWLNLERPGQRPQRISTKIHVDAPTPAKRKENRLLAEAAYHAQMGDLARDRFDLPIAAPTRTFGLHALWYQEHHTVHHRGAVREVRILARLRRTFAAVALDALTPRRWQEYVTERTRDGVSASTIGRELAVMKAILNTAVPEFLEFNPLGSVRRKSPRVKAKRTVTASEETRLLAALKRIDVELHDLYVVGVGTLLRRENLIYLQRGEHRGDRIVIDTKTGPHQVPLNGPTPLQRRAAKVLAKRMPKAHDGFFFPGWKAKFAPYEDQGHPGVLFLKKVRRAAKAAGLPWGLANNGIVWHTATRATGATRMLREYQVDVRTVQIIGGWTSLDQMAEYLGIDREGLFGETHTRAVHARA
jgi:integrase